MLTRRKFITMTPAAIASWPMMAEALSKAGSTRKYGFISGIVGKELEGDWRKALKDIASFGYSEMETGEYPGESPENFIQFLESLGIKIVAGGFEFGATDAQLEQSLNLLKKLGSKIAVVYWPWYSGGPFSSDDCKKSAERLNYLGRICHDNGFEFSWHNHDKEFIPNENGLPFDYLMNNTDPKSVKCELDIYWAVKGGADPVKLLRKYNGRFNILHIKDMAAGDKKDFECPGSGIIDFPSVFREADNQGIKHFMVERDNVPDGIACLRSASQYFKSL